MPKPLNPLRVDPTRTITLRRAFEREMTRRFEKLRREVVKLVATEDAFGLEKPRSPKFSLATNKRWQFARDEDKVKSFRRWLKGQIELGILEASGEDVDPKKPWTAEYVASAHKKGVIRAYTDSHAEALAEKQAFYAGAKQQFLRDTFSSQQSMKTLELLYTRAFHELKDVTEAMSQKMTRVLVDGLANGLGPDDIARNLSSEIKKITKTRARTIARTETIHAYAEGQLDSFEMLGVEEIGVMAEWSTAEDSKVCKLCRPLEGVVMTVKEARGLLPRHPNCRCAWIPAFSDPDLKEPGQKRTKGQIEKALGKSFSAEHPKSRNPKAASVWLGASRSFGTRSAQLGRAIKKSLKGAKSRKKRR